MTNQINVKPQAHVSDVKNKIEEALRRSAELDSQRIVVETTDGSVTLKGTVRTWVEHEDAVNAAWSAPGVTRVVDRLSVQP